MTAIASVQAFCVKCHNHFPLDQFVWGGTSEVLGS